MAVRFCGGVGSRGGAPVALSRVRTYLGVGEELVGGLESSLHLALGGGGAAADGPVGVQGATLVEGDGVSDEGLRETSVRAQLIRRVPVATRCRRVAGGGPGLASDAAGFFRPKPRGPRTSAAPLRLEDIGSGEVPLSQRSAMRKYTHSPVEREVGHGCGSSGDGDSSEDGLHGCLGLRAVSKVPRIVPAPC
jgi:hypothetical protein